MPFFKYLEEEYLVVQHQRTVAPEYGTESTVPSNRADEKLSELAVILMNRWKRAEAHKRDGLQTRDKRNLDQLSIRERAQFFEDNTDQNFAAKQARLNARVILIRKWLSRQGATFIGRYGIDHRKLKNRLVKYDADLARQGATKITVNADQLHTSDGRLLDTASMVTHTSGPGHAIYVLSAEGNFHVGSHKVGTYHHSSLLAGGEVACAGEMRVSSGRLQYLSNKSGHYKPDTDDLYHVLAVLQDRGNSMGFEVGSMQKDFSVQRFASVMDFMTEENMTDADYDEVQQGILDLLANEGAYDTPPVDAYGNPLEADPY